MRPPPHPVALRMMSRVLLYTAILWPFHHDVPGLHCPGASPSSRLNEDIMISTIHLLLYPTLSFHSWCFLLSSFPILASCAAVHPPPSCSRTASDRVRPRRRPNSWRCCAPVLWWRAELSAVGDARGSRIRRRHTLWPPVFFTLKARFLATGRQQPHTYSVIVSGILVGRGAVHLDRHGRSAIPVRGRVACEL